MTSESATIDLSDGTAVVGADAPEATAAPDADAAPDPEDGSVEAERDRGRSRSKPAPPPDRPAKFLADLTRAMRTTALAERDELLAGHQAEATAYLEQLQSESTERAAAIRRTADDDIVAIRDWSKAELARIREETDRRIASRRNELAEELEGETSRATRAASTVDQRVEAYRAEMERFFERLLGIEDPATFAALAGNLPEPPPFDAAASIPAVTASIIAEPIGAKARVDTRAKAEPAVDASPVVEAEPTVDAEPEAKAEEVAEPEGGPEPQAEAHAKPTGEAEGDTAPAVEPGADDATAASDPRVTALSLMPDFAAAESEANLGLDPLAFLGPTTPASSTPADTAAATTPTGEIVTTKLVVTGLVSVAGIAAFKRQVARRPGVQSVTVSSGPDGEFVFTVVHHEGVDLKGAIAGLEGFSAAVTGSSDGAIALTAHDPEAAA